MVQNTFIVIITSTVGRPPLELSRLEAACIHIHRESAALTILLVDVLRYAIFGLAVSVVFFLLLLISDLIP